MSYTCVTCDVLRVIEYSIPPMKNKTLFYNSYIQEEQEAKYRLTFENAIELNEHYTNEIRKRFIEKSKNAAPFF